MDPRAQGSRLARVPRLWFLWFLWYPHSISGASALGSLVFMVPSWCLEAFGRLIDSLGNWFRKFRHTVPQKPSKPSPANDPQTYVFYGKIMSGVEIDSQPPQRNKKNYKPYSSETLASLGQEQSPQDGQALWFLGFVDFEPHWAPHWAPRPPPNP